MATLRGPTLLDSSMPGGGNLFTEVGVMLVEGRTPEPGSPRGHREGPHLHPLTPHMQHHSCIEGDFLCERAAGLRKHLSLLSENSAPMTIDVLLSPDCPCGAARASSVNICCLASSEDLLIEQWTVSLLSSKSQSTNAVTEKVLLQAIRSQLHFSQLSAWYSLGKVKNVTYRLSHPVGCPEFSRPPLHHDFPIAMLPSGSYVKVSLKSLPRLENMPTVSCPLHSSASPLSTTMTVVKSVFAELGHCLLDPPARIPAVKQGFTMWRDNKTSSPTKSRHKPVRSPTKHRHHIVPGLVDDRMQSGCKHIGKHHCEDDYEERGSPPYPVHHSHHSRGGEKCSSAGKQQSDCDDDLNKTPVHGVLDILRTQVCNRVSIQQGPSAKAENILSAILKTGGASSSNPLKRKRSGLETSSKRLLSGEKPCSGACVELAESFTRLEITTKDSPQVPKKLPVPRTPFVKPTSLKHIPSPIPLRKNTWVTDSSSEETECDSPRSNGPSPRCIPPLSQRLSSPRKSRHSSLLGNFEESILKGRLKPVSMVEGFSADLGASGTFCPQHLKLPVTVSFFSFEPHSAPYLGHIKLSKKGYTVPRSGTIQVTLFNPLGTVIKMFVVSYDMKDMPDNSLTMVRQRAWGPGNRLTYLIHLRFCSSKSGRISLHSDIKMLISRQYDVDSSICLDMESPAQLRSVTEQTADPKYSIKPAQLKRSI